MHKSLKVFEALLFGLVILLLVFIPLYPKIPLVDISKTFVSVRLEDFVLAAVFLLWGIYLLISGKLVGLFKDRLNQNILLFFFIGGVSLFSAIFVTDTVNLHLGALNYLRRFEYMLILPLVISVIKTQKQVKIALLVLAVVTVIVGIYAIGQVYLKWPVITTTNSELSKGEVLTLTPGARPNSTFAGHYDFPIFLVMMLTLITSFFFKWKQLWSKISLVALGGFSFGVLVMTAARLSFVAAIFGIASVLILTGKKWLILALVVVGCLALLYPSQLRDRLISTVMVTFRGPSTSYQPQNDNQSNRSKLNIPTLPIATESAEDKATPSGSIPSDIVPGEPTDITELGVYRSSSIRFDVEWPRALRAFYKNPLLGSGYSSLGEATDNDYYRSLGEIGLLGTLAFVLIHIEIIKRLWRGVRSEDRFIKYLSAGVLSVVAAFLFNAALIDVFEASKIAILYWMIIGLNLGLLKQK